MNKISVVADSSINWMQQLKNGIIPTGNQSIDTLMSTYYLSIDNYKTYSGLFNWHEVIFKSDSNYNILPMTLLFDTITGVNYSERPNTIGDGNNITSEILNNYVELIYSYGWEDCLSGCVFKRYWKFNVDFNCNVEYVGSYGSSLLITNKHNFFQDTSISFFPNPFKERIMITGTSEPYTYKITNLIGQELIKGKSTDNRIENLGNLISGTYILSVQTTNQSVTFKIIKE